MKRLLTIGGAALAIATVAPAGAGAASFPVTSTANSGGGSLRAALEAANASAGPDSIPISVNGTIQLESVLPTIAEQVEISGPGAASLTVRRNSGASFRIFSIGSEVSASIFGITIANGLSNQGAGILSFGPLLLERVVVSGNEAVASGGTQAVAAGGGILSFGPLTMRDSTVSGNSATASNGTSQTVAQNAGLASFGDALISRSTISGNNATASSSAGQTVAQGGGIVLFGATATIERSTISGNSASANGSGIQTVAQGGGIELFSDSSTLDRSTVSGNAVSAANGSGQTVAQGGGLLGSGTMLISGATITGNAVHTTQTAKSANLGAFEETTVRDSIVSNAQGDAPSCGAPAKSGGFNIDDGTSCGLTQPTDQQSTNPGIDPSLGANGGPTLTHALLPGSAAIDRGNAFGATSDQRDLGRPSDFSAILNASGGDGSGVGAVEEQDLVTPDTRITKRPPRKTRKRRAVFVFSSDEAGVAFECSLDRRAFAPCTSPRIFKKVKRGKAHRFRVRAVDAAGHVDASPATAKWRVKRKQHHKRRPHRHNHEHHFGRR